MLSKIANQGEARMSEPQSVVCTYRVRKEKDAEFRDLISRHWTVLRAQDLVSEIAPQVFRGEDGQDRPFFMETFEWVSAEAPDTAHHLPSVTAIWEPMGLCCEPREGLPAMEFHRVQRLS